MIRPETEADLAEAIRAAPGPLRPTGGGTRGVAGGGLALSVAGLSGVVLYEPGAMTLVVRAGTALTEVEALLAAEGQRLAFEPPHPAALMGRDGVSTIGGVIAANASGPARVQAGAARDHVLGLRMVDGTGAILKAGGRVMKNVTGIDLTRLMCGSHGTLGVITEVALKVLPAPERSVTLSWPDLAPEGAVALMSRALGTPFGVSGAARDPVSGRTHLRVEGFAESVAYRLGRLQAMLGAAYVTEGAASDALWRGIRDGAALVGQAGDLWQVKTRPGDGAEVAARLTRAGGQPPLIDWGGGLLTAVLPPGTDLRAALAGLPLHATRLRATTPGDGIPGFPPQAAGLRLLSARLQESFDPHRRLNPGLMD